MQASASSVQLPMSSSPQTHHSQQPSGRAPYSYTSTTAAPSLSMASASEAALNVPRYLDSSRPSKTFRHGSLPSSIQGIPGSLASDTASEYRYGSSYVPVQHNSGEMHPSNYGTDSATATQTAPSRDYYTPSTHWTTSAGEGSSTAAYTSGGEGRSYTSPGQYKGSVTGPAVVKSTDGVAPPPGSGAQGLYNGPPRESINAMDHYSWHAI